MDDVAKRIEIIKRPLELHKSCLLAEEINRCDRCFLITELEKANHRIKNIEAEAGGWKAVVNLDEEKITNLQSQLTSAREALAATREYLEQRGIRQKGTIGRTVILPKIDEALANLKEDKGYG